MTADFLSSTVLGVDSVFQFDILKALPQEYYWMILLLGVVLGITGAFYNWFTLKAQSVYRKMEKVPMVVKMMIPFGCAGVLGLTVPKLLGSGHALIEELTHTEMLLSTVIFILIGRFLFSAVSFGPVRRAGFSSHSWLLADSLAEHLRRPGVQFFGLDPGYVNNFVLLAMAGYFSAIGTRSADWDYSDF